MNNIFYLIGINVIGLIIIITTLNLNSNQEINTFSAYYNSEGAFAGFIQKKKKFI